MDLQDSSLRALKLPICSPDLSPLLFPSDPCEPRAKE